MNIEASAALEPYTAPLPVEDHANDNSMLNEQYRTETKVANVNNPIDAGSKPKNGSSGSTGKTNNTTEVNAANVNNLNDTVSKSDSGSSRRTDIVSDTAEEKASEPVVYVGQTGYDPYELPED